MNWHGKQSSQFPTMSSVTFSCFFKLKFNNKMQLRLPFFLSFFYFYFSIGHWSLFDSIQLNQTELIKNANSFSSNSFSFYLSSASNRFRYQTLSFQNFLIFSIKTLCLLLFLFWKQPHKQFNQTKNFHLTSTFSSFVLTISLV